jgi:hypothetical protein
VTAVAEEQMGEPALGIAEISGRENSYGIGQLVVRRIEGCGEMPSPSLWVKKQLSSATEWHALI